MKRIYHVAVVLAVTPIVVSALRNGLGGWVPTGDAAITTLRIKDVFTAHPPLVGMAALTSTGTSHPYSFPGALQLYLLAVPVKLLGTSWGPLLGMAAINSAFLVLTAWLLRRRVGFLGAIIGCAFLASLVWAVGSQVIVDLTPMQMDPLPFILLLVAAWSVADGDDAALLVLAVVGNYLVLDHLKFTIAAPGLGLFALVAYALHLRSTRRADPDGWPARRRHAAAWFGGALAFTAVVWLPPLYQEVAY